MSRPRLDQYPGFKVTATKTLGAFNPFKDAEPPEPKRTEDVVAMIAKERKKLENVLDSPPCAAEQAQGTESELPQGQTLFPRMVKPKAAEPLDEVAHELVPMSQPRSKDGERLLYKHPKLPRVGPKGAYWLLVGHSDRSEAAWLIQFDGAANPNPGPASSGAVLWSPKDLEGKRTPVFEMGKYLGKATNNIAEGQGMLLGLKIAAMRGARELLIEGDSELIIFQHTGKYRVNDKNLKVWWSEAQAAMMDESAFDWIAIRQVPREQNERADSITKEVLARKEGFQRNGGRI
jgi:ribonuclease HI